MLLRCGKGKEKISRIAERFGVASVTKEGGADTLWIHAVSVGEAKSALILVDKLTKTKNFKLDVLITSNTLTSAQIIADEITLISNKGQSNGKKIYHQFVPIDNPYCVKKFLKYWQIKTAIFLESEIWPCILERLSYHKIPSYLVNARISKRSMDRWLWAEKFAIKPFKSFKVIYVQNKKDVDLFQKLSNGQCFYYGNLKNEAKALSYDLEQLRLLKKKIGSRKVFLAASTHQGEEESVIKVHRDLLKKYPDLLSIIVIRHPNRSGEVQNLLQDLNYAVFRGDFNDQHEVLLVDQMGILGLFYKLCDFAFIAGSLQEVGGHNPYEALKLDCAVISGKNYFNFHETYEGLRVNNGCLIVNDEKELSDAAASIFENKDIALDLIKNAKEFLDQDCDVTDQVIAAIGNSD